MESFIKTVVDKVVSVKFFIILLSSALFYVDKLNQDGWIMMVLSITGMRAMNEIGSMYKEIRLGTATRTSLDPSAFSRTGKTRIK